LSDFSSEVSETTRFSGTNTFEFTETIQSYRVPIGVTQIRVDAQGGKGGQSGTAVGGLGGRVQATLAVTPGEILFAFVGGGGGDNHPAKYQALITGGWNGGGTGIGVLQAAADGGILSIGVDSNQNYLHPGKVLTSMLKRVDVAVYNAFKEGENLTPGVSLLDLKAEGVGYSLDDNNRALLSAEMLDKVNAAAGRIKAGEVTVHDFMSDNACPVE
jgi:hypothetical protein